MKYQKIMINAGFSCPNRDGRVSYGGCTYCRTDSFNPSYCQGSIREQLEAGKRFFAGKYPEMRYLAYFQAYSNTYAPLEVLKTRYEEALSVEDVVGLVIATRPDCISTETLCYLQELNLRTRVKLELGIESLYDKTLLRINRGHNATTAIEAVNRCAEAGLMVGVHIILGLPGESREEMLREADMLNDLPIRSIKIHQLQILRDTQMAEEWTQHREDFLELTLEEYVTLAADFVQRLKPEIKVERYASSAPAPLLLSPRWGVKPGEVERRIVEMRRKLASEAK